MCVYIENNFNDAKKIKHSLQAQNGVASVCDIEEAGIPEGGSNLVIHIY